VRIGLLLSQHGPGIPLTNPGGVHVFDEGLQLLGEVLVCVVGDVLLHVVEHILHLHQDDGLPGTNDLRPWEVGQGPDVAYKLLHLDAVVVDHHQAICCDPFSETTLPMELAARDTDPWEGGAEGHISPFSMSMWIEFTRTDGMLFR
jgi:hypothetical protein